MDFVDRMNDPPPGKNCLVGRTPFEVWGVHFRNVNYLAHAYLSFGSDPVLVGNLINDFVRGKAWQEYPEDIQKGIRLHRQIDQFTDMHPEVKIAKPYLAPAVGRYSGVFLDIVFDHFLATDTQRFPTGSLEPFAQHVYSVLRGVPFDLPEDFLHMFHYMETQDWLNNYSRREGIRRSLEGMARRARYLPDQVPIYACFEQHYESLKQQYRIFFPELEKYARQQFAL